MSVTHKCVILSLLSDFYWLGEKQMDDGLLKWSLQHIYFLLSAHL